MTAHEGTTPHDPIAAGTGMDAVTLHVADLDRMTAYYRDAVALTVLDDAAPASQADGRLPHAASATDRGGVVTLGRGSAPVVVLRHTPDLPPAVPGSAGLFHTAILFDDEPTLAAAVASVAQRAPGTYVGSADHLVSEAFYFTDPEGNGVELYRDRGRDQWEYDGGRVRMDSLRLDPNAFLREHLTDAGVEDPSAAGGAVVGHVHLQVGDVPTARAFYVDALGFDVMADWHGALFVSAGGYHHHLAMNTWHSRGAGPRASSLGLGEVSIRVPAADDLAALVARLHDHRVAVADDGATVTFEDPWRNLVRVGVGEPA